jgi:4-amino-4-deoxy-L-arabinose transferase-like glycosyltransferase
MTDDSAETGLAALQELSDRQQRHKARHRLDARSKLAARRDLALGTRTGPESVEAASPFLIYQPKAEANGHLNHRAPRPQRAELPARIAIALLAVVMVIGALARLTGLGNKPGWQSDEPVYTDIAGNILRHGALNEHIQIGMSWAPFLFHPPFYFVLLAGWFKLFGVGIPQARMLSVLDSMLMFGLLAWLLWRLHGRAVTVLTMVLVIFDGWLLYVQRISYIENTLILIVVAALVCYERALRRPSAASFILTGALLGFVVVFKHTGLYVVAAVALNWLIIRREGKMHLLMGAVAAAIIALYVAGMIWLFDFGPHKWYIAQSIIQVERVLGIRQSRGTLGSPLKLLHLLTHQYAIFIPSLIVATAALVMLVRRGIECWRSRSFEPVRANSLLFSWSVAGIIVFGASQLRFPQYFILVLVPMYCYFWTELFRIARPTPARLAAITAIAATIGIAGVGSFYDRVLTHKDNALWQVKQYAHNRIPADDVIITEEEIGDEIHQKWCSVARAGACFRSATYAITYQTYLQPIAPPGDTAFTLIMKGAKPVASFTGFKEVITVWMLH